MASTYINDLRLEEMATGENSGSWGTKTNNNLELIAEAFGRGVETITDTSNTDITMADGTSDDARSLALRINSSEDLTADRQITLLPNTINKVWIIENNTTGGKSITVAQGSGGTVSIRNGESKIIAATGSGSSASVFEVTEKLSITDLFVSGNIEVDTTVDNAYMGQFALWDTSQTSRPYLRLAKSLGASIGTHAAMTTNDLMGEFVFSGSDGSDFYDGAGIRAITTQDYTGSNGGAKLEFRTTANDSQTLETKLTLDQDGTLEALDITADGLTIAIPAGQASPYNAIDLKSNNNDGNAGNILRFTDTDTTAVNNSPIGQIDFYATETASVVASISGNNADASPSGDLRFKTAEDTTLVERLRIENDGRIKFLDSAGSNAYMSWDNVNTGLIIGDNVNTTTADANLNLNTNLNHTAEFTASISGTVLTVTAVASGSIAVNDIVYGSGTSIRTKIISNGTGSGGTGTYNVSISQTVSSGTMRAISEAKNTIRFTDQDTAVAGEGPIGTLEFYSSDNAGIKAFIGATYQDGGPDGNLIFATNQFSVDPDGAKERMRIKYNGYVGIGDNNPSYPLQIYGATENTLLHLESGDAAALISFQDNTTNNFPKIGAEGDNLVFKSGSAGTEWMNLSSTGVLSLYGATAQMYQSGGTAVEFSFDSNRAGSSQTIGRTRWYWNSNEVARIQGITGDDPTNKDNGELAFYTSESGGTVAQAMRILSNQKVTVGGTIDFGTQNKEKLLVDDTGGGTISMRRNDGSISAGNHLGGLMFYGSDGATVGTDGRGAKIVVEAAGTWSAGNFDSKMRFYTTQTATETERLRINYNGHIEVGPQQELAYLVLGSEGAGVSNDSNWLRGNGKLLQYNCSGGTSSAHAWEVGGAEGMRLDKDRIFTLNVQPSFMVVKTSNQNNLPVEADQTVTWESEKWDMNSDFDISSNSFTAPVTGKYFLSVSLRMQHIDTGADYYAFKITTSNREYRQLYSGSSFGATDPIYFSISNSVVADMDANDTAFIEVYQQGGTAQTDIDDAITYTFFQGYLMG